MYDEGHLAILKGNLSHLEGCVAKTTGLKNPVRHQGPARVCSTPSQSALAAIMADNKIVARRRGGAART
jgi:dihydroxy-acid dehydratase